MVQPEALSSVHAVDSDGGLLGVARLVTLVQSDPATPLVEVCDTDPVRVGTDADIMDVAVLMSDYNLITIPVVDDERHLLGLITVDDVLEVTLPDDWRRREAAEPPDARHGTPSDDAGRPRHAAREAAARASRAEAGAGQAGFRRARPSAPG